MFPIEPHVVLTDLQVFGAYPTSTNGHSANGHRHKVNGCDGAAAATRFPEDRELVDLRRKVETLPAIEQAKGMLMAYYGITGGQAFDLLRHWSMGHNIKLNTVCAILVSEAVQPTELPFESLQKALRRWETEQ